MILHSLFTIAVSVIGGALIGAVLMSMVSKWRIGAAIYSRSAAA